MFFTLLAFLVTLGILITFHELGHYLVARVCDVKILRFSLGFGRVLLRRIDKRGTEWALSVLPLGGYVKMQEDPPPGAMPELAKQSYNLQPVAKRIAIVVAGPIFNLMLAIVLYAAIYFHGTQELAALVDTPAAHTPAAEAGFKAGDRMVSINSHPVVSWNDARWQLVDHLSVGGQLNIQVQTATGLKQQRNLLLSHYHFDPSKVDPLEQIGLRVAPGQVIVRAVTIGGSAQKSGLQTGDIIESIGDLIKPDIDTVVKTIGAHAGKSLTLEISRNKILKKIVLVPEALQVNPVTVGRIGVQLSTQFEQVTVRYGLLDSLTHGVKRTYDTAWLSLRMIGRMLIGKLSWHNISGPVSIADYAGQTARAGLAVYISFLALISVSLGVLNLLPIPMLDGGHLLYYLVELARGKPLSERYIQIGQRIGVGLLGALMSVALFNDLIRLFA